jgi:hypothetical protein
VIPQKSSVALALGVKSKSQQKFSIKGVIINVYARRMLYKHLLFAISTISTKAKNKKHK